EPAGCASRQRCLAAVSVSLQLAMAASTPVAARQSSRRARQASTHTWSRSRQASFAAWKSSVQPSLHSLYPCFASSRQESPARAAGIPSTAASAAIDARDLIESAAFIGVLPDSTPRYHGHVVSVQVSGPPHLSPEVHCASPGPTTVQRF